MWQSSLVRRVAPPLRLALLFAAGSVAIFLNTAAPNAATAQCSGEAGDADEACTAPAGGAAPVAVMRSTPATAAPGSLQVPATAAKRAAPDPNKEERAFRERVHRALRNLDRGGTAHPSLKNPECAAIVERIAGVRPLLRSLRTEVREQARANMNVLNESFRERGC